MNQKPTVFVTNFNPRFTGVSATTAAVCKIQRSQLDVALVGKPLGGCPSPLNKREAIALSKIQPPDKPFNIWHVRRNSEMQLAIFARDILKLPIKIVFTSAAQRRHSAWPRWLISRMDAVIATSEEAASFVPNVVSVIPHGIDLERFSPAEDQTVSWSKTGMPGEYGIINVGRVRPEKGTDLFVEAMIEALPKLPKATAIIAGATKPKDISFREKIETQIVKPTIEGLKKDNLPYKGFVFIGLIKVGNEPKVIEYNVRMGDPETEVVIPRIKNDFLAILQAVDEGRLDEINLEIDPSVAATVVTVSGGYPEAYEKGKRITGLADQGDKMIFHAGTKQEGDDIITAGGRVLAVTSFGKDHQEAVEASYKIISKINFEGINYRKDIGFDL